MIIYKIYVFSKSEENYDYTKLFSFEYSSLSEALKAYENYSNEFLLSGQQVKICLFSLDYEV